MDLADFLFTRDDIKYLVYDLYLQGYSEEEIMIQTNLEMKTIGNIIDCFNYLNL